MGVECLGLAYVNTLLQVNDDLITALTLRLLMGHLYELPPMVELSILAGQKALAM